MGPLARPAAAGVAAALAYLAEQEIDRRVIDCRSDDLELLGGLVTSDSRWWPSLGLALHLAAGASFGIIFDRLVAPRLWGPYWLRGVTMAQVENVVLWPVLIVLDRVHPGVRSGRLAPFNRPVYFLQAVLRHLTLGAVLGLLLGPAGRDTSTAATRSSRAGVP